MYSLNINSARTSLWEWITSYLPDAEWFVGIYLNMVEWEGD